MINTPRCCLHLFSNHLGEPDSQDMRPPKRQSGYDREDTFKPISDLFMFQIHHYYDGFE